MLLKMKCTRVTGGSRTHTRIRFVTLLQACGIAVFSHPNRAGISDRKCTRGMGENDETACRCLRGSRGTNVEPLQLDIYIKFCSRLGATRLLCHYLSSYVPNCSVAVGEEAPTRIALRTRSSPPGGLHAYHRAFLTGTYSPLPYMAELYYRNR